MKLKSQILDTLKKVEFFLLNNRYLALAMVLFIITAFITNISFILVFPSLYLTIVSYIMPKSFTKGLLSSVENLEDEKKVINLEITDIPANKMEECKGFLDENLKQFGLKNFQVKALDSENTIRVSFHTVQPIFNIRKLIIDEFPISIIWSSSEISESYKSIDAMGRLIFKTIVEGKATPHSRIVFNDDLSKKVIVVDSDGLYKEEIILSIDVLKRGYIEGNAKKDEMNVKLRVDLDKENPNKL